MKPSTITLAATALFALGACNTQEAGDNNTSGVIENAAVPADNAAAPAANAADAAKPTGGDAAAGNTAAPPAGDKPTADTGPAPAPANEQAAGDKPQG